MMKKLTQIAALCLLSSASFSMESYQWGAQDFEKAEILLNQAKDLKLIKKEIDGLVENKKSSERSVLAKALFVDDLSEKRFGKNKASLEEKVKARQEKYQILNFKDNVQIGEFHSLLKKTRQPVKPNAKCQEGFENLETVDAAVKFLKDFTEVLDEGLFGFAYDQSTKDPSTMPLLIEDVAAGRDYFKRRLGKLEGSVKSLVEEKSIQPAPIPLDSQDKHTLSDLKKFGFISPKELSFNISSIATLLDENFDENSGSSQRVRNCKQYLKSIIQKTAKDFKGGKLQEERDTFIKYLLKIIGNSSLTVDLKKMPYNPLIAASKANVQEGYIAFKSLIDPIKDYLSTTDDLGSNVNNKHVYEEQFSLSIVPDLNDSNSSKKSYANAEVNVDLPIPVSSEVTDAFKLRDSVIDLFADGILVGEDSTIEGIIDSLTQLGGKISDLESKVSKGNIKYV